MAMSVISRPDRPNVGSPHVGTDVGNNQTDVGTDVRQGTQMSVPMSVGT